jgi:hypothetical protein
MSAQPIYGNQTFNARNIASSEIQRLKADQVQASTVTSSTITSNSVVSNSVNATGPLGTVTANSYVAVLATTDPTGPTGPNGTVPVLGQIVYAATGAIGSGAAGGLYVYTGAAGWVHTNLTSA